MFNLDVQPRAIADRQGVPIRDPLPPRSSPGIAGSNVPSSLRSESTWHDAPVGRANALIQCWEPGSLSLSLSLSLGKTSGIWVEPAVDRRRELAGRVGRISSKRRGAHPGDGPGQITHCRRVLVSVGDDPPAPTAPRSVLPSAARRGQQSSAARGGVVHAPRRLDALAEHALTDAATRGAERAAGAERPERPEHVAVGGVAVEGHRATDRDDRRAGGDGRRGLGRR
jgi:hypothetical protein